jgi:hypothetical protein
MQPVFQKNRSLIFLLALGLALLLEPQVAVAAPALCFLHGIITPRYETKEKTSLSDMLRIHFDISKAEEKAKCEQMMESYCLHNIFEKDYSPLLIKGSFKPDSDKPEGTNYTFSEKCKLQAE